jgi:integrative and conjugative element protein (TIGR02256 family)
MNLPLEYQSLDAGFGLRLQQSHFNTLFAWCESSAGKETGGVIIGHYAGDRVWAIINEVTPPPPDSKAGRSWFHRGISGMLNSLVHKWHEKPRTYYLGEWHYHPDAHPDPSPDDRKTMKRRDLRSGFQCPEPILIIIGGDAQRWSARCFVYPASLEEIELLPKIPPEVTL